MLISLFINLCLYYFFRFVRFFLRDWFLWFNIWFFVPFFFCLFLHITSVLNSFFSTSFFTLLLFFYLLCSSLPVCSFSIIAYLWFQSCGSSFWAWNSWKIWMFVWIVIKCEDRTDQYCNSDNDNFSESHKLVLIYLISYQKIKINKRKFHSTT